MSSDQSELKRQAGRAALEHVRDGMVLGIGTGSTAEAFVHELADAVARGLSVTGVPTSERTADLCNALSVPLTTLEQHPRLNLTIDGADELDAELSLVKGGGGALLREKIVASSSDRMIVIADESKLVDALGAFPLPIEINRFGMSATIGAIETAIGRLGLSADLTLRQSEGELYVTDGGHLIVDASFGRIVDPERLSTALLHIPGVVEHGLFLGLADLAIVATPNGPQLLTPASQEDKDLVS